MNDSESGRDPWEEFELLPRASWLRRTWVNLLCRAFPEYQISRGKKGDPVVLAEAYRRLKRRGRLPRLPEDV